MRFYRNEKNHCHDALWKGQRCDPFRNQRNLLPRYYDCLFQKYRSPGSYVLYVPEVFFQKIHSDGFLVAFGECPSAVALDQARLSHCSISHDHHLKTTREGDTVLYKRMLREKIHTIIINCAPPPPM